MFAFLIVIAAYVGWTGSPSRQLPWQSAATPESDPGAVGPIRGIPRQEPSTYG